MRLTKRKKFNPNCPKCSAAGRGKPCGCSYYPGVYAQVNGSDPSTGKRIQVTKHFETTTAARKWARSQEVEIDKETFTPPTNQTLGEYLKLWLETIRPPEGKAQAGSIRLSTFEKYRTLLESYVIPRIGGVQITKLTPERLEILYRDLLASGSVGGNGRKGGKPLASSTVHAVHVALHRALGAGERKGTLSRNVASLVESPPRPAKSDKAAWSEDQLRRFLEAIAEERWYPLYYLIASTGIRRAEAAGLAWDSLTLPSLKEEAAGTRAFASIHRQLSASVSYQARLDDVKTQSGRRRIALDGETARLLREWKKVQAEERLAWGEDYQDRHGLVFTWEDGRWVHPDYITKAFKRYAKKAGVPVIGAVHLLRHTFATLGLRHGLPEWKIAKRLGHSSPAVTHAFYAHHTDQDDVSTADEFSLKVLNQRAN